MLWCIRRRRDHGYWRSPCEKSRIRVDAVRPTSLPSTVHLVLLAIFFVSTSDAYTITPPTSNSDWSELTTLITDTFDAPSSSSTSTTADSWNWKWVERPLTWQYNYKHYVQTARKLRGSKYGVFLARTENDDVVGVVEVGVQLDPETQETRPTIGSLAVAATLQQRGIGRALISKCEQVVSQRWKNQCIFAQVCTTNTRALQFFEACGYQLHNNDATPVPVTLQRRRKLETSLHFILSKTVTAQVAGAVVDGQKRGERRTAEGKKQWIW